MKNKKPILNIFILLFAGLTFYILDSYSFSSHDDCLYRFIVKPTADNYLAMTSDDYHPQPIHTFADVLQSQKNFYMNSNGRFIVHVVAQCCCSFMTRSQFAVVNSLVFMLFMWFFAKLATENKSFFVLSPSYLIAIIAALWFLFSSKEAVFWGNIANVTNYHFPAVAIMALIYIIEKRIETKTFLIPYVLFVAVTASLQESFTIGLGAALILYYFTNIKKSSTLDTQKSAFSTLIPFFVGAAFCIFSPGNFHRLQSFSEPSSSFFLKPSLTFTAFLLITPSFVLLVFSLAVETFRNKAKALLFVKDNQILFTTIVVSILFDMFVAFTNQPQITVINLFSLILLLRLWLKKLQQLSQKGNTAISSMLILLTLATFLPIVQTRKTMQSAFNDMLLQAHTTKDGTVVARNYEHIVYRVEHNFLLKQYVSAFMFVGDDMCKREFSLMMSDGKNPRLIKSILPFSKEDIAGMCINRNRVGDNIFKLSDNYYVKVDKNKTLPCSDVKIKAEIDDLASIILHKKVMTVESCEHFKMEETNYYLFNHKPNIKKIVSSF